jgi:hypothetical protein
MGSVLCVVRLKGNQCIEKERECIARLTVGSSLYNFPSVTFGVVSYFAFFPFPTERHLALSLKPSYYGYASRA